MPKVKTLEEKRKDKIIKTILSASKGKQKDLANVWGITQSAVSQRLSSGNITLYDLYRAGNILAIDPEELAELITRKGKT